MWLWLAEHNDGGWGVAMLLGMLGLWALIVGTLLWVTVSQRTTHAPPPTTRPVAPAVPHAGGPATRAGQIQAKRLARCEIDPEDSGTRRDVLTWASCP